MLQEGSATLLLKKKVMVTAMPAPEKIFREKTQTISKRVAAAMSNCSSHL
jgi:hypothetical protein